MKNVRAYFAVISKDWISIMSGGAGLALAVIGFYSPSEWQPRGFLGLGVLCLFYVSYRAWLTERRQREDLLQRLTPKLEFIHDREVKPFYEELTGEDGGKIRCLRVALRNAGGDEIPKARLVLQGCDPGSSSAIHLEHELQPMGKPQGTLTFSVPAHGTVFIDVAREVIPPDQGRSAFYLCYAQEAQNELPPIGDKRYTLILRAEGAGAAIRCSLDLGGRLAWRLDALKLLPVTETLAPIKSSFG